MSSYPATATSPGTLRPRSNRHASNTPNAVESLAQAMASGGMERARHRQSVCRRRRRRRGNARCADRGIGRTGKQSQPPPATGAQVLTKPVKCRSIVAANARRPGMPARAVVDNHRDTLRRARRHHRVRHADGRDHRVHVIRKNIRQGAARIVARHDERQHPVRRLLDFQPEPHQQVREVARSDVRHQHGHKPAPLRNQRTRNLVGCVAQRLRSRLHLAPRPRRNAAAIPKTPRHRRLRHACKNSDVVRCRTSTHGRWQNEPVHRHSLPRR